MSRGDYHLRDGFFKKTNFPLKNVNKKQTLITVKLPNAWTSQYDKISHQHNILPPPKY